MRLEALAYLERANRYSNTSQALGLTGEPLSETDASRICREHEPADEAG